MSRFAVTTKTRLFFSNLRMAATHQAAISEFWENKNWKLCATGWIKLLSLTSSARSAGILTLQGFCDSFAPRNYDEHISNIVFHLELAWGFGPQLASKLGLVMRHNAHRKITCIPWLRVSISKATASSLKHNQRLGLGAPEAERSWKISIKLYRKTRTQITLLTFNCNLGRVASLMQIQANLDSRYWTTVYYCWHVASDTCGQEAFHQRDAQLLRVIPLNRRHLASQAIYALRCGAQLPPTHTTKNLERTGHEWLKHL